MSVIFNDGFEIGPKWEKIKLPEGSEDFRIKEIVVDSEFNSVKCRFEDDDIDKLKDYM